MKTGETFKTKKAEEWFLAAWVVVVLLVLPIWGAIPMLIGSVIGLAAYAVLFREPLRSRGWLKALVLPAAVAAGVGAVIAFALIRGLWH